MSLVKRKAILKSHGQLHKQKKAIFGIRDAIELNLIQLKHIDIITLTDEHNDEVMSLVQKKVLEDEDYCPLTSLTELRHLCNLGIDTRQLQRRLNPPIDDDVLDFE